MRIAMASSYNPFEPGGVQTQIAQLKRQLEARGHEVTVFALINHLRSGKLQRSRIRTSQWPDLKLLLNGSVFNMNLDLVAGMRLLKEIDPADYDVMHIQEPLLPFFSLCATLYTPLPTVVTWHSYVEEASFLKTFFGNFWITGCRLALLPINPYYQRLMRQNLQVRTAVSPSAAKVGERFLPGHEKFRIIPNGIEVEQGERDYPRPAVMSDDKFNLLFVGRIGDQRKGLAVLLRAYSLIRDAHPNLRLIVAGPGEMNRRCLKIWSECGLEDVVFTGRLPRDDLMALYKHADAFCAPNVGGESFGVVLAEAIASQTPLIATELQGFRNVIGDDDAIFVKPGDVEGLARAIVAAMEDPERLKRITASASRNIGKLSWSSVADQILQAYTDAIEAYQHTDKHKLTAGEGAL